MTSDNESAPDQGRARRTIIIQTPNATREIELTGRRIIGAVGLTGVVLAWTLSASAGFLVSRLSPVNEGRDLALVEAAYEKRITGLQEALDAESGRLQSARKQLALAQSRILSQASQLGEARELELELTAGLQEMRGKLAQAVTSRDLAESRASELDIALASLQSKHATGTSAEEMGVVLSAVSDALSTAVRDRDTQRGDLHRLESEIATMELRMQINADRQERLVASLEDAVEVSFKPLEKMFENSGLDVDTLISGVRSSYTGIGGPELFPASVTGMADPELNDRFEDLMTGMDRMNMMRIAAAKLPYAMPVHQSHRFTSGFGTRRDPKTGGRRAHNGIDLAGPRGTPILSTGDGVVVFAGWQSGFGNLIKIRHAYGFETLYAHLNKIHVKVGDRIARGEHIGDMGTTGRSTGVHLHYEVRIGGKPVNPMTYIKAARNVF